MPTVVAIRHVVFEDLGVWHPWFEANGWAVRYVDAPVADIAALDPLDGDLLIVLGGPIGAYQTDRYPFLAEELRLIPRRVESGKPLLGVCLGHQAIGAAFGAVIAGASQIMHGKTSAIRHTGKGLYAGLKNPFVAGRYHSLSIRRDSLPADLVEEAASDDGEIMGIRHRRHMTYGVQFHPESVLTPSGKRLLRNFLDLAAGQAGGEE